MSEKEKFSRRISVYGQGNPPPSAESATKRLEELKSFVKDIEYQLNHPNMEKFENDFHYDNWKQRAISALGHFRSEIKYLNGYLGFVPVNIQHVSSQRQYNIDLEKLKLFVQNLVTDMQARIYRPRYTCDSMPVSLEDAKIRIEEFRSVYGTFIKLFSQVREEAKKLKIGEKGLPKANRPLVDLYRSYCLEKKLVSGYISSMGGRIDWSAFMLSLVDEAVVQGFKLNNEQAKIIEDIRQDILNRQESMFQKGL